MKLIYRPLEHWDRKVIARRPHSPFQSDYTSTLKLIEREAKMLGATRVIVELALRETDLRLDGKPYADAKTDHPGVTVALDSRHGALKYTADKFVTWQENLRAIALGLEALRKVDRYGMTTRGEQYAGWKALPSGEGVLCDRGAELIRQHGGVREALKATHPDHGGDPLDFAAVQAARGE